MIPWIAAFIAAATLPLFGSDYLLQIGGFVAIQSIAVIGLGLLTGFAGRISLAQGALYGIGAYTTAILVTQYPAIPPFAALPAAIAAAVAVGTILGSPAIRLSGLYFVMSTIGLQQIVWIVLMHWTGLTGGPQGIRGIPPLSIAGFAFDPPDRFYCAELAGAAGFLHAFFLRFVHPDMFSLDLSVVDLTMAMFGGYRSLDGMLLSSVILGSASEYLRPFGKFRLVAYGAILLLTMMIAPRGILAAIRRRR